DLRGGDLAAEQAHLVLDLVRQLLDLGVDDGAALARRPHPGDDLVAVEGLDRPVGLGDEQCRLLDALEGREAVRARQALTPAADGRPVVGQARVDHLGVVGSAARAVHARRITTFCGRYGSSTCWPACSDGPPLRSTSLST